MRFLIDPGPPHPEVTIVGGSEVVRPVLVAFRVTCRIVTPCHMGLETKITWYKSSDMSEVNMSASHHVSQIQTTNRFADVQYTELRFAPFTDNHTDTYVCVAGTDRGNSSASIFVDIRREYLVERIYRLFFFFFFHELQSLTMHYIRDERGDEALTLCRPMGLGFPAVRTRQEGKEKIWEAVRRTIWQLGVFSKLDVVACLYEDYSIHSLQNVLRCERTSVVWWCL